MSDADIAALPAVRRIQYLRALNSGATIGSDETLILRILRASPADIVLVVDGADAWDLLSAMHGQEFTDLRELLRAQYYGQTAQLTALRIVRRCMDGATSDWEEQLVADVIVARSDRVALIELIGAHYSDMSGADDFHRGLNKLEWQLSGDHQARVQAVLSADGARAGLRERRVVVTQACCGRVSALTKSSSWRVVQHSYSSQNGA